ncbi:hypothetical protein FNF28_01040 [Cafeteria roenbergensis]|uniref:U3 small nucleolar RNA-associated protein 15 C-terminal domain-containing protein n=1 Tax=Cafeteria roenbergensis TaxID=33653 RepID=A0A5A8DZW4_CAFRO|nr:hypothetical protein FNF28_01040 [Cafeteria roenbergensis]
MADYVKMELQRSVEAELPEADEARFWKRFRVPVVKHHHGIVAHADFSPVAPYDIAVTSGPRVSIYNSRTAEVRRELPSFRDLARSGVYRKDGRLIVSGSDNGLVRVFNAKTRAPMRQFTAHAAPVHLTRFSTDGDSVFTASDDRTARLFDVAVGREVACVRGHSDYIRAGAQAVTGPSLWVTGSYDHTVCLWDLRGSGARSAESSWAGAAAASGPGAECAMKMNHGAPVSSCVCLPGGSLLVTAGSNYFKVWDLTAGGKLLQTVSAHQKTITTLCLSAQGDRLLSGGLDGHVKVYGVGDFTPVFGLKHGGAITSLALAPDLSRLVVGTADGTLTVRQRAVKAAEAVVDRARSAAVRGGTYRFFLRGAGEAAGEGDVTAPPDRKPKLKKHDTLLRAFKYGAALDAALENGTGVVVSSTLEELAQRGGIRVALAGRDADSLEPMLAFIVKHAATPRYTGLLTDVAHAILDLYGPVIGRSPRMRTMLRALESRARGEMNVQRELLRLQGALDMLLNSAGAAAAAAAEAAAGGAELDDLDDLAKTAGGAGITASTGVLAASAVLPELPGADSGSSSTSAQPSGRASASVAGSRKRRVSFDGDADATAPPSAAAAAASEPKRGASSSSSSSSSDNPAPAESGIARAGGSARRAGAKRQRRAGSKA